MKKRLLTLMLASLTTLTLASCGNTNTSSSPTESSSTSVAPVSSSDDGVKKGEFDVTRFAKSGYTSNDYLSATTSLQWNPLTWETADDSSVLSYMSSSLYDYQINAAGNGYEVVCELAEALPTDVTASYAGTYGVKEGETAKAWRIKLNKDATWDNGDKITADDYVYTMQQMLDSEQLNRRADSFYGGDFSIVNAKNYLYSGKTSYSTIGSKGYESIAAAQAAGLTVYVNAWGFWGAEGYVDANNNPCAQYVEVTDETTYDTAPNSGEDTFSGKSLGDMLAGKYAAYAASYCYVKEEVPVTTWDQVGFKKIDDYTIEIVTEKAMPSPVEFYIPYEMSSISLIHKATYEAAWTTAPDGSKINNYGLAPDGDLSTTRSYGPYKLSYFEDDKKVKFARNEEWYGYKRGVTNGAEAHDKQYQCTNIEWDVISEHSTALMQFEKGGLDAIGLQSADYDKYGSSKYLVYTPQSYTTKVSFLTDEEKLKAFQAEKGDGKNRTIQLVKEFRAALSYAINREDFVAQFTPSAAAGYGMLNYMYQVFDEDGTTYAYRDSDAAKEAMCKLYGVSYGAGAKYETLDEAYAAVTGYDVNKAKELLTQAYTVAKEKGYYKDGEEIEILFSVYNSDTIYLNMVNYFDTAIKAAAVGTPLEGKISFNYVADSDYYNSMYAGKAQFIYTTWGGASYGTFGMLASCYCDAADGSGNQMELGFETDKKMVTINVKGTEKTFSLQAWAYWMNNDDEKGGAVAEVYGGFNELDDDTKCEVFAACEYAYLEEYVTIPVYYRQTASVVSKKVSYGSSTYIDLVGFGGIRHMQFNFTDAEWAEFIKDANNLQY